MVMVLGLMPVALAALTLDLSTYETGTTTSGSGIATYYVSSSATFSVTPQLRNDGATTDADYTYDWYLDNVLQTHLYNRNSVTVSWNDLPVSGTAQLSCSVTATPKDGTLGSPTTRSVSWTLARGNAYTDLRGTATATVYDTSSGYVLGDTDDENGSSILDQIEDYINRYYYGDYNNRRDDYINYISFDDVRGNSGDLDARSRYDYTRSQAEGISFIPRTTGSSTFYFTVTTRYSGTYSGSFTIKVVEGYASSALTFSAASGDNLELDAASFENWWYDIYSNGTLRYVEFTSVSNGSIYANYNGSRGSNVVDSRNPTACYVSPSRNQTALDGLTFVPSSNRATTVTIRFTAYGTTSRNGSNTTSRNGTATILFVNASADLEYNTGVNGNVSLVSSDFTEAYRKAVGNNSSNLTFQFRNVPTNGSLTYTAGNRTNNLTASNIRTQTFTTSTISNVTYTAGRTGTTDKVEFICYSGGTARFIGTITFNARPTTVSGLVANVNCTSANGVRINAIDLWGLDVSMQSSSYVSFGVPSGGSLYIQETPLNAGARLSFTTGSGYQLFSDLTYRPASGATTGTVTIPFSAYASNGNEVANGNVLITLNVPAQTLPPTNPTTPTTPSNPGSVSRPPVPINPSVTFGDVSNDAAGSWYYSEVLTLASAGIIGGDGDGSFRPNRNVSYGEALALIMRAVGYNIQQGTGEAWAMPYWRKAMEDGLLPSNVSYTLTDAVDRNTIAHIAAKAMKLTPVTNPTSSPFPDSSDPYVLALYNAGIVAGSSSGFEGSSPLTRAQVAVIIWRIYNQRDNIGNTTPGTSQTPGQDGNQNQGNNGGDREPDRNPPFGY